MTANDFQRGRLLDFFKTLSNANRLKIVGVLTKGDLALRDVVVNTALKPGEALHHLQHLFDLGLVTCQGGTGESQFHLELSTLQALAQQYLRNLRPSRQVIDKSINGGFDEYSHQIITRYTDNKGCIRMFPQSQKRRNALLRYALGNLESNRIYTEKEINLSLARYHEDTSALRRYLVDAGMLARERDGSAYWRVD